MGKSYYFLDEILRVAQKHPFYNPDILHPPHPRDIPQIIQGDDHLNSTDLCQYRITKKKDIFDVIQRLATDDSPSNTFRYSSYTSVTGGGWSCGVPMLFLTDSAENKRQRETTGELMKAVGIIEATDWVVNIHVSGYLYRSLDLMTDIIEYACGTVLCAGCDMSPDRVTDAIRQYRCNCLCGSVTELIKMSHHIASLPSQIREQVKVNKILYTCEPLSRSQHDCLIATFGSVAIYSVIGSAEAGSWAVANPQLTGEPATDATEFIYDTRMMHVDILPLCDESNNARIEPVPDGDMGVITLTSLQRLRNPLVRYDSGDIGSLHPFPPTAQSQIPAEVVGHLKLLRVYGRDKRFSFSWSSNYIEYSMVHNLMQSEGYRVLQWQVVIGLDDIPGREYFEIRLLRDRQQQEGLLISDEVLVAKIKWAFVVVTNPAFRVRFVEDVADFERSSTGRKVTRFVDYR